jgi:hypothetical protein
LRQRPRAGGRADSFEQMDPIAHHVILPCPQSPDGNDGNDTRACRRGECEKGNARV